MSETGLNGFVFPTGYLLVGEFDSLGHAHAYASQLSSSMASVSAFRLLDVSMTSAGAWMAAWSAEKPKSGSGSLAVIATSPKSKILAAVFSLAEPAAKEVDCGIIVESSKISDVLQTCFALEEQGVQPLEIRIKRSGPSGAVAFLATVGAIGETVKASGGATITRTALVGDYRRFFL